MPLAAFDLETADPLPADRGAPLRVGITCAALAAPEVRYWHAAPRLSPEQAAATVRDLQAAVAAGHTLVTWNGCRFDFAVLAAESGLTAECTALARAHIDLMFIVVCLKGHFLGLDKALDGAGLPGKRKQVQLRDGTLLEKMDGALAPQLWARGEYDAVLAYLHDDVARLLELAHAVQRTRQIRWNSQAGKPQSAAVPRLLTVQECLALPEPNTSWMKEPPRRADFVAWMSAV